MASFRSLARLSDYLKDNAATPLSIRMEMNEHKVHVFAAR